MHYKNDNEQRHEQCKINLKQNRSEKYSGESTARKFPFWNWQANRERERMSNNNKKEGHEILSIHRDDQKTHSSCEWKVFQAATVSDFSRQLCHQPFSIWCFFRPLRTKCTEVKVWRYIQFFRVQCARCHRVAAIAIASLSSNFFLWSPPPLPTTISSFHFYFLLYKPFSVLFFIYLLRTFKQNASNVDALIDRCTSMCISCIWKDGKRQRRNKKRRRAKSFYPRDIQAYYTT